MDLVGLWTEAKMDSHLRGVLCGLAILILPTANCQTFTTLYNFNGSDGSAPNGLAQGPDGNFYGTTNSGGANKNNACSFGCGTVFEITTSGVLTTLYNFNSLPLGSGYEPIGSLTLASNGDFYGVTEAGGIENPTCGYYGCGTIFKMTSSGTITTVHRFNFTDGGYPVTAPVEDSNGALYGTTDFGGSDGQGTAYRVRPSSFATLDSFDIYSGSAYGLTLGSDGNFYGTSAQGGFDDWGTIIRLTPAGTLTTLYSFTRKNALPTGALLEASDGNLYGVTCGGTFNAGTVFRFTSSRVLFTLHAFNYTDGLCPNSLIQASDGNFYGTTGDWGSYYGTIFKLTPDGTLTTLHSFVQTDGQGPTSLVQGSDGNFYGATVAGGAYGYGTIFQLSTGL